MKTVNTIVKRFTYVNVIYVLINVNCWDKSYVLQHSTHSPYNVGIYRNRGKRAEGKEKEGRNRERGRKEKRKRTGIGGREWKEKRKR